MNDQDRCQSESMQKSVNLLLDNMHLLMHNHIPHLQRSVEEASDKAEQAYGMASEAAKESAQTRKFIIAAAGFITLFIAIAQCV